MEIVSCMLCISCLGLISGPLLVIYYMRQHEKKAQEQAYFQRLRSLDSLRQLTPVDFERFTANLFTQMGYLVKPTRTTGDEGVDLFLTKGNWTAIVQCKRYKGDVGQPVIRDLYGALLHNRANEAYLITTGKFSLPAQKWAAGKPIHLIDGSMLVKWLDFFGGRSQPA